MLGETDHGFILIRKLVRDQIRAIQNGDEPLGVNSDPAKDEVIRLIPQATQRFHTQRRRSIAAGEYAT